MEKEKILFLGDSLTDYGLFPTLIETYFTINSSLNNYQFFNAGLGWETASGLSETVWKLPRPCVIDRINDVLQNVKPNWVIILYGINDGIYAPLSDERFDAYKNGITNLVNLLHKNNIKVALVTPTPFDFISYRGTLYPLGQTEYSSDKPFIFYDDVMEHYSNWVLSCGIADKVINVRKPMLEMFFNERISNPKRSLGDGLHYGLEGNLVVANAILQDFFGLSATQADYKTSSATHSAKSNAQNQSNAKSNAQNQSNATQTDCKTSNATQAILDKSVVKTKLYKLLLKRNTEQHRFLKACIGYKSLDIDSVLPKAELDVLVDKINSKISKMLAKGKENQHIFDYHGFNAFNFYYNNIKAIIATPNGNSNKKWVLRTRFFGAFDYVDVALLQNGYHIAYLDFEQMYGNNKSVKLLYDFCNFIVGKYNLNKKVVLEGFSRGGLYAINFAVMYPQSVSAIYLDAPVVDIRSWPLGRGKGCGSVEDWKVCSANYAYTTNEDYKYEALLHHNLTALAGSNIPLILVSGDADTVVPYEENGKQLIDAYEKAGSAYQLVLKPNANHHPHSIGKPEKIVEFILRNS
ncbi:MAG: prolyl oligopeptidase family serine peptidase [Clostridia bacterium]